MTHYNKLVRDKMPEILDGKGVGYEMRVAGEGEYKEELFKKLDEEVGEFMEEKNMEELADVIEVLEAIKKLPEFQDVEKIRQDKWERKGGFEKRLILKGEKYK